MDNVSLDAIPVIYFDGITPREGVFHIIILHDFALDSGMLIKQIYPVIVCAAMYPFE
jgi:hypothetical protein